MDTETGTRLGHHVGARALSGRGREMDTNAQPNAQRYAPVFAALGDTTRLALLTKLCNGEPQSIATLTDGAAITRQAITKHLRVLEDAGLVRSVRVGRENHFVLERSSLDGARTYLDEVSSLWDAALERLRAFVEDT